MRRARGENHFALALDPRRNVCLSVNILDPDGGFTLEKDPADCDLGDEAIVRSALNDSVEVGKSRVATRLVACVQGAWNIKNTSLGAPIGVFGRGGADVAPGAQKVRCES